MNALNARSIELLDYAQRTVQDLSQHSVLNSFWNDLTVVLKGSTSRGNADNYSDIDLVIFCDEPIRQKIVAGYYENHLTNRKDGIFIFIDNGHYHVESYDQLKGYFFHQDFIHAWDYQQAIPIHDPKNLYPAIIEAGQKNLFADLPTLVKRAYLDLQLDLDWMRMPIIRADGPSTLLHYTKLLGGICRMAFLLDSRPFPPDKWLFTYLDSTNFGKNHLDAVLHYFTECPSVLALIRDQPFERHPLYLGAAELIGFISVDIQNQFGEQPWLDHWYDYV